MSAEDDGTGPPFFQAMLADGTTMVGITPENIAAMQDGLPLTLKLSQLEGAPIPNGEVIVYFGRDVADCQKQLMEGMARAAMREDRYSTATAANAVKRTQH